jgi:hypothetical protein
VTVAAEIPFPTGAKPDPDEVADWVELRALASGRAIKFGDIKAAASGEGVTDPDALGEETWHVLEARSRLCGSRWPLVLAGRRLSRRLHLRVSLTLYRYLGLLSVAENLDSDDRALFEDVVALLLSALTGRPGYRTGHPAWRGQLSSFRDRVERYGLLAGLAPLEKGQTPLPYDKDLGLDAVSWRRFADARGGDLHYVAQCATGGDWEDKLDDFKFSAWGPHIHWAVPPTRVFATPRVLLVSSSKWIRITQEGGLILDRPRLLELSTSVRIPTWLMRHIQARLRVSRE